MNKLDITGKDLSTASPRERLEFYVQVGKLWLQGKASGSQRGIVPKTYTADSLEFSVIEGTSVKQFRCCDINRKAAYYHSLFFLIFYGEPSGSSGKGEETDNGLCKKLNLSDAVAAAFTGITKAASEKSKDTKPPTPKWKPRKMDKHQKPPDPFDPFSGILY